MCYDYIEIKDLLKEVCILFINLLERYKSQGLISKQLYNELIENKIKFINDIERVDTKEL